MWQRASALRNFIAAIILPIALSACLSEVTSEVDNSTVSDPNSDTNSAPQISGNPPGLIQAGVNYSFTPQASDPDGDALSFSINNKPTWLNFDSANGALSGVPLLGSEGTYGDIELSVSDGQSSSVLPRFAITVEPINAANMPPQISGTPASSALVGRSYSFTPTGFDPNGDMLTYSIQNMPAWASFDTRNGRLFGTPLAGDENTYADITISVSDGSLSDSLPPASLTVRTTDIVPLTSIPEIPFDYAQAPGAATRSGPLPDTLSAGEVLAFDGQNVSDDVNFTCNGTEANPAFIVGGTLTGNNDVLRISGSWCIFVDTLFDNIQPRTSGDHHVFRNVEITRVAGKNGSSFAGSNIVIVDSEIHHNQGDDRHGIHVASGADSVWILRNYVHHNGGDGIQACHQCSANPPRNVYIGQNLFHSDRENSIDFKYIENVIVEGNTIHSLVSAPPDELWCFDDGSSCGVFSSGSDGSGIVIGSDGGPTNVLIVGNEIFDTNNAIRVEEGIAIRIEDNVFHDVNDQCLQLDKDGLNTVFTGNSCVNAGRGIFQNWRVNFSLTVDNNLFENVTGPSVEYETRSVGEASTLTNNIFRNSGSVIYANTVATTEVTINALPNANNNQVE